jgi:hypothetical protein
MRSREWAATFDEPESENGAQRCTEQGPVEAP